MNNNKAENYSIAVGGALGKERGGACGVQALPSSTLDLALTLQRGSRSRRSSVSSHDSHPGADALKEFRQRPPRIDQVFQHIGHDYRVMRAATPGYDGCFLVASGW